MSIRAILGNAMIATGGYVPRPKPAALSAADITPPSTSEVLPASNIYMFQLADPYLLVGFTVPNWLRLVFFVIALICAPLLLA